MKRNVTKMMVVFVLTIVLVTNPTSLIIDQLSFTAQAATSGEQNALEHAKDCLNSGYLGLLGFSKKGLKKQLLFDGYTKKEATYAVENCEVNWKEQAQKSALTYVAVETYSKKELMNKLKQDGFTKKQIKYAIKAAGC